MSLTAWVSVLTVAIAGAGVTLALFNYLATNFRDLNNRITGTDDKIDGARTSLSTRVDETRVALCTRIDDTRTELISRIDATRSELNAKIDDTRSELKADIAGLRAGVSILESRVYELALRGEPRSH